MISQETYYLMALTRIKGLGSLRIKKLLQFYGDPKKIFDASFDELEKIIGRINARNIKNFDDFDLVDKEIKYTRKHGLDILSIFSENYPAKLLHIPDLPIILFKKGSYNFESPRHLSIVGTRKITPYGMKFTHQFVSDLSPYNPVIVSGLAFGIDIEAHKAALENGLLTVAVMGTSFQSIYPDVHAEYFGRITENGAVLSEFWSYEQTEKQFFVRRNRIVAGISEATVVVESGISGGALITAQLAFDYNRDVFAVPGRVTDTYSKGCHAIIKKQIAKILTGAEDIVTQMNWALEEKPPAPVQKKLFVDLNPDEEKIVHFLRENDAEHLDIIALETGMPVSKTSQLLMMLELNGVVQSIPGKKFKLL